MSIEDAMWCQAVQKYNHQVVQHPRIGIGPPITHEQKRGATLTRHAPREVFGSCLRFLGGFLGQSFLGRFFRFGLFSL
ncbi:MAG: hypothetical protein K2K84_07280, partial [Muribaculaceae bacterium]|nr:hypothetical protein [Muribaculaceae bacterium]